MIGHVFDLYFVVKGHLVGNCFGDCGRETVSENSLRIIGGTEIGDKN